jgi:DNA mismatch endonuclease (patch repair protein)
MDVLTPRQRSHCMSQIRGKNTGPELVIRKALWALKLRYRTHAAIPGRPDIIFSAARVAVFIDGCFWHGCALHGVRPKTNRDFWREKIHKNKARDRRVTRLLFAEGWSVLRFWEHEIEDNPRKVTTAIVKAVLKGRRQDIKKLLPVRSAPPTPPYTHTPARSRSRRNT